MLAYCRTHYIRQAVLLCLLAVPPAVGTALWHPQWHPRNAAARREHEIGIATVRGWPAPVLWLDARPEAEYRARHVPGALPLTSAEWNRQVPPVLDAWKPGTKIVVYCSGGTCRASEEIAGRLRTELGLPDVHFLQGGFESWLRGHK